MKQLKPNREFVLRHLFVALLMLGMSGWFAYDGWVKYPSMSQDALYEMVEKQPAPNSEAAAKVAANAIHRQKEFTCLALLASLVIGAHLAAVMRQRFEYSDDGFAVDGAKYSFNDIAQVDDGAWQKKGIVRLILKNTRRVTLDAWHHSGVKEFHEILERTLKS